MKLEIFQIDAFADQAFGGNPAAVIPLQNWLETEQMQAIAMENNLSETAFLVPGKDAAHWNLRWFTPTTEVPLCGHATFASGVAVLRHLHPQLEKVFFETKSAKLSVEKSGTDFVVDLPAAARSDWQPSAELIAALGVPVLASGNANFPYIVVEDEAFVRNIAIKQGVALANLTKPGELILSAAGAGDLDFLMRVFVPGVGIDEDPVTGAAFASISPFWAQDLGKLKMRALQASNRQGHVQVGVTGNRVRLCGGAIDYMRGQITL